MAADRYRRSSGAQTVGSFKNGTCLRKCYYETYRFSEDLDFTVLGGPEAPEDLAPIFAAERAGQLSGVPARTLYDWADAAVLVPDYPKTRPKAWSYRDLAFRCGTGRRRHRPGGPASTRRMTLRLLL